MTIGNEYLCKKRALFLSVAIVVASIACFLFIIIKMTGVTYDTVEYNQKTYAAALESGVELKQEITGDITNVRFFSVKYGTYERCNEGIIQVALYKDGLIVQCWDTDASTLVDNGYQQYMLDELLDIEPEHDYCFTIRGTFEGDDMVAVWGTVDDKDTFQMCFEVGRESNNLNTAKVTCFAAIVVASALLSLFVVLKCVDVSGKKNNRFYDVLAYTCLGGFLFSWFRYISDLLEEFSPSRCTKHNFIVVMVVMSFVFLCLYFSKRTEKDIMIPLYICVLFFVYSLRAPSDLFSSFLWAEDGTILVSDSISKGFLSLFTVTSGTHWFVPRAVSLLCYYVCSLFNDISLMPAIQGVLCKLIATLSIGYFLSNRFEWLVKQRALRFLVCAFVVFGIPFYSTDVVVCDTSLPFVMNFGAFLIGMDALCRNDARPISWMETLFLAALCMSNAAAPVPAAVACMAFVRWIMPVIRKKDKCFKLIVPEVVKVLLVCSCALIQVIGIFSSSRSDVEMDIVDRARICFKHFVFWPYSGSYKEWSLFILALLGFVALAVLAKIPWKIVIYSTLYSFGFLLYCSMVANPDDIEFVLFREANGGSRYILISYMIASFITALEICLVWNRNGYVTIVSTILLIVFSVMSVLTYSVDMIGDEFTEAYEHSIGVFDADGLQIMRIPIGPWSPWGMSIPWNTDNYAETTAEVSYHVDALDGSCSNYRISNPSIIPIAGNASPEDGNAFRYIFIYTGNNTYLAPVDRFDCQNIMCNGKDYDYVFLVNDSLLQGDEIIFVGITDDDQMYTWEADCVLHD